MRFIRLSGHVKKERKKTLISLIKVIVPLDEIRGSSLWLDKNIMLDGWVEMKYYITLIFVYKF